MKTGSAWISVARTIALVALLCAIVLSPAASAGQRGMQGASADHAPVGPAAPPPQPFNPYGTVKLNGQNVEVGTLVGGWCAGTLWDTFPAELAEGETWYSLVMPADDSATTELEGCRSGQTVTFTIDGLPTPQSTVWLAGQTRVDLATTSGLELTKQVSSDGVTWQDADGTADALTVDAGSDLSWRVSVTSTGAVTVGLTLTDTVNGTTTRSLASLCDPPPPATLPPAGEVGAGYTCLIHDVAPAGAYRNVVSVTVSAAGWSETATDGASVFGIARGVEVRKRVWDGVTWYEADSASAYPDVPEDGDLTWQVAITNTGNVTVSLALTDTLDGVPLDLLGLCATPPPATLPPAGTLGASYVCQISDSATLGSHRNVVTTTVAFGASGVTVSDAAGYVGIEAGWTVYLPLVLR
jgi:hypothetical protein